MNTESKGKAWYGKIYRKLETMLVEVDSLASQCKVSSESSDPQGFDSVKDEPEKLPDSGMSDVEQRKNTLSLQRCKTPSDNPFDQKFDIQQNVRLDDQIEEDTSKEKLTDSVLIDETMLSSSSLPEEHNDSNQVVARSLCQEKPIISQESLPHYGIPTGDSNLVPFATDIQTASVQDNCMKVNQDEFFIEDFDVDSLDTINLYDMTFREDPSDFDDKLLYAARDRTMQLRSFKRKIMDALTSKRRREKEYEQLAIWFGDGDMGCDLASTKEHVTTSLDSKSSKSNVPFASEDSEWELL